MKRTIVEELKQKKPFATVHEEAGVGLLRTADVFRRRMTRVVEPFGITIQQYNVLRILRGAGEEGLPTLEIAVRMIEETPGITRLLDRLEAKRLVRRERCPEDRRRVLCWITPDGLDILDRVDVPLREEGRKVMGKLTPGELRQLVDLFDTLRAD